MFQPPSQYPPLPSQILHHVTVDRSEQGKACYNQKKEDVHDEDAAQKEKGDDDDDHDDDDDDNDGISLFTNAQH